MNLTTSHLASRDALITAEKERFLKVEREQKKWKLAVDNPLF